MNWEAIGAVGEIIGALGVIASLFYVAYQVRQNTHQGKLNTTALESANSEALNAATNDVRLRLAENPELAKLYTKGLNDPHSLSDEEMIRFRMFVASGVSNGQLIYESSKRGVSEQWEGIRNPILRILNNPGGKYFWENFKIDYTQDFQREIDELLARHQDQ